MNKNFYFILFCIILALSSIFLLPFVEAVVATELVNENGAPQSVEEEDDPVPPIKRKAEGIKGSGKSKASDEAAEAAVARRASILTSESESENGYREPLTNLDQIKADQGAEISLEDKEDSAAIIPRVEIIVDSSGSMGQVLNKEKTKMYYMKKMLTRYFTDQYRQKAETGLRVYGSRRKGDCTDNELMIPFGEFNLGNIETKVSQLEPVGKTPIYRSVKLALQDLKSYEGPKSLIIFTDGEDTCGGDPCKAKIKPDENLDVQMFVVAINFKPNGNDLKSVSCLGETNIAESEEDLFENLGKIHQKIFKAQINLKVISPNPVVPVQLFKWTDGKFKFYRVFTAAFGAIVPPGRYQAVVELEPYFKFDSFEVPPKKVVTLSVKGAGTFQVDFVDKILDVAFYDKNMKPIAKFKSDTPQLIPTGKWTLKISKNPFYESLTPQYYIYPNGRYHYLVKEIGALVVKAKNLIGFYVYNNKHKLVGNYLTNSPFALPISTYHIHVNSNCFFEEIQIFNDRKLQVLKCP